MTGYMIQDIKYLTAS